MNINKVPRIKLVAKPADAKTNPLKVRRVKERIPNRTLSALFYPRPKYPSPKPLQTDESHRGLVSRFRNSYNLFSENA